MISIYTLSQKNTTQVLKFSIFFLFPPDLLTLTQGHVESILSKFITYGEECTGLEKRKLGLRQGKINFPYISVILFFRSPVVTLITDMDWSQLSFPDHCTVLIKLTAQKLI